ncbi:MAG: TauD/TfdA dioxygenase family protein [Burkholderiales bacterium]
MALSLQRTSAPLGAEIKGVDLAREIDERTFGEIVAAWRQHEVIFFRGQTLTPDRHVAISRRFGELERHVRQECCRPGYPVIFVVSNVVENGKPIGSQDAGLFWHSDLCYKKEPSRGSLFYAREVPMENGEPRGDTMFSSMTAAYEALPDGTKRKLGGRLAVNSYVHGYYRDRKSGPRRALSPEQMSQTPDVAHPVVRVHPETGRKCLFVNEGYTTRILDMDETESDALLAELFAHIKRPEFVYRHQWQVGDFLVWDNCSTQHRAVPDYALPQRRLMERTTLTGGAVLAA